MNNLRRNKLIQSAAAILLAVGLKAFYSTASVNDLRWILAPTTFLVEIVTGEQFNFESYEGYMNSDYSFLIADSCSGVNFLIAEFLMISLLLIWNEESDSTNWRSIPFAASAAYVFTLAANTVRISVAVKLHRMDAPSIWLNPEQLHRFQGISIYFGFLMLIFVLFDRIQRQESRKSLLQYLLPLAVYWLVTLGVPLLNGAYGRGVDLREHVLFVVVIPVLLLSPLILIEIVRKVRVRSEI
jgi:exosortase K